MIHDYQRVLLFNKKTFGDSSPVKKRATLFQGGGRGALGCKQPRYPVLQPGGYEGGGPTRLPTVMTEAELLAKMTGAGLGREISGWKEEVC